ncbi:MAG: TorF family putative porin [Gemmatimonadales bacterium]
MQQAKVGGAFVIIGALLSAIPAQAQVTVGADLGLFSSYVWRGITYTNKPVIQPDIYLTVPVSSASITVGGWGNIEPGAYNGATDISENGSDGAGLAEFDWWGEVGFPVGPKTTLIAGVTGYHFPNDDGFTSAANTIEIYGKAAFDVLLSPKLAVWYDVDKIKGAYFEGSVSHSVAASEKVSVTLGALAGLNAGQGIPSDPLSTESFNFADDGFTHLDLSAAVPFTAGPLSFTPALHFVITGDEATKFTKIDATTGLPNSKDVKLWGGVMISWSKALGAEPEAPASSE